MAVAAFIAGDWGTTHLRLYLCDAYGGILDQRQGEGAAQVKGNFAATLDSLIGSWQDEQPLPVLLCGMVGSSIGWRQVAPVSCPVLPQRVAQATVVVKEDHRNPVRIVPGLTCRNPVDAPDFMRGEESQLLGALQLQSSLQHGRHLLCMPGTHTKWVILDDGNVQHFITAPTGELFALLCNYSVLVRDVQQSADPTMTEDAAFTRGLQEIMRFPNAGLLHRIFESRSRRLSGELSSGDAPSFLSGLLIGADVKDALTLLLDHTPDQVVIIGSNSLTTLYAQALSIFGCRTLALAGDRAVCAGLGYIHQLLYGQGAS